MQGRRFDVRLWEKTGTTILHLQVRSIGYGMRSSRVLTAAEPPWPAEPIRMLYMASGSLARHAAVWSIDKGDFF